MIPPTISPNAEGDDLVKYYLKSRIPIDDESSRGRRET